MYSCVLECEFADLVGCFGCYCVTPVTLFIIRNEYEWERVEWGAYSRQGAY